ncbi:unnamed protein product [Vitrella brassicaformis CCMP3155]|uniref:Uncharacterized protein n=1 Tax=Vitrella brassicaformis (strain CCMP3155) TaxID=1169540 RepID=A0A0G4GHF5_VITBC|nr:unnamed protein product [Vitrella brassicaformis CCMP3155]|eukprot:CEM28962.1 unnamed protein product [Vitrella brassicaformis CCMP3155]
MVGQRCFFELKAMLCDTANQATHAKIRPHVLTDLRVKETARVYSKWKEAYGWRSASTWDRWSTVLQGPYLRQHPPRPNHFPHHHNPTPEWRHSMDLEGPAAAAAAAAGVAEDVLVPSPDGGEVAGFPPPILQQPDGDIDDDVPLAARRKRRHREPAATIDGDRQDGRPSPPKMVHYDTYVKADGDATGAAPSSAPPRPNASRFPHHHNPAQGHPFHSTNRTQDDRTVPRATVHERTYLGEVKGRFLTPTLTHYDEYTTSNHDVFDKVVLESRWRLGCVKVRWWYLHPPPRPLQDTEGQVSDDKLVKKALVTTRTYLGDVKVRVLSPRLVQYDTYTTADHDELEDVLVYESYRLGCVKVRSWYSGRTFTALKPPPTIIEAVKLGTKEATAAPLAAGASASTLFESGQTHAPDSPASGSRRGSVSPDHGAASPRRGSQPQLPPVQEQPEGEGTTEGAAEGTEGQQGEGEGEVEGNWLKVWAEVVCVGQGGEGEAT